MGKGKLGGGGYGGGGPRAVRELKVEPKALTDLCAGRNGRALSSNLPPQDVDMVLPMNSRFPSSWALLAGGLLFSLVASSAAWAQGTINFSTRITGSVDARVLLGGFGGGLGPATSLQFGQLYQVGDGGTSRPLGVPVPFRDTPAVAQGYITSGGTVELPGVAAGATAQIKMVAWDSRMGATYGEALARGMGGIGESATLSITVGGGTLPPANLVGLQSFVISYVPEPGMGVLMMLGSTVLFMRERRRRSGLPRATRSVRP